MGEIKKGDLVEVLYNGNKWRVDVVGVSKKKNTVRVAFGDYMNATYRIENVKKLINKEGSWIYEGD